MSLLRESFSVDRFLECFRDIVITGGQGLANMAMWRTLEELVHSTFAIDVGFLLEVSDLEDESQAQNSDHFRTFYSTHKPAAMTGTNHNTEPSLADEF